MSNKEINRKLAGIDDFYNEGVQACRDLAKKTKAEFKEDFGFDMIDLLKTEVKTYLDLDYDEKTYLDLDYDESEYLSEKAIDLIFNFIKGE